MTDTSDIKSLTLSSDEASTLSARLEALARTARIFGSGIADVDVRVTWSLEPGSEEIRWSETGEGRKAVSIRLDLNHIIGLLRSTDQRDKQAYVTAFKAGFLHELGHILYSPGPVGQDLRDSGRLSELASGLSARHRELLQNEELRKLLETIHHTLEDGRIDRQLNRDFRGAPRYLQAHAEQALAVLRGGSSSITPAGPRTGGARAEMPDVVGQLVAILYLHLWGWEGKWDSTAVRPDVVAAARRLSASLDRCGLRESQTCLSQWVLEELLPELDHLIGFGEPEEEEEVSGPLGGAAADTGLKPEDMEGESERGRPGVELSKDSTSTSDDERRRELPQLTQDTALLETTRKLQEELGASGLLSRIDRPDRAAIQGARGEEGEVSEVITYPHASGGLVIDEILGVKARLVTPTERTRAAMEDVARVYGPRALDAFAAEAKALRRAFQVNFERKYDGRYRTGRHIGTRNLRRYVVQNDLRVFQRMVVPDRLSYYFHLLLDVSPSMLTNKNLQKALAVGYAFTEALDRLRVPVDVSLYSSAITELYDHRCDILDRYFGGAFGYLSSGTHEIEAIAFARERTRRVAEERKIIVVITDGQPNGLALARAGGQDLRSYYRDHLVPWLKRDGIDLLAIGIGATPSYHATAAAISSGWESIGVLMRLLDEIIARGNRSHAALWR